MWGIDCELRMMQLHHLRPDNPLGGWAADTLARSRNNKLPNAETELRITSRASERQCDEESIRKGLDPAQ